MPTTAHAPIDTPLTEGQTAAMNQQLDQLRAQIDGFDEQIAALLRQRYDVTDEIGHLKIALGLPIPHPVRQQHRRDLLLDLAARHGLSQETLSTVYEGINAQVVARHRAIVQGLRTSS